MVERGICKRFISVFRNVFLKGFVYRVFLPLVSGEWRNGSNSSYNCTPFLDSLLTKGKF